MQDHANAQQHKAQDLCNKFNLIFIQVVLSRQQFLLGIHFQRTHIIAFQKTHSHQHRIVYVILFLAIRTMLHMIQKSIQIRYAQLIINKRDDMLLRFHTAPHFSFHTVCLPQVLKSLYCLSAIFYKLTKKGSHRLPFHKYMHQEGFEPSRGHPRRILSPLRLPFRH